METKQVNINLTTEELLIVTGALISVTQGRGVVASDTAKDLISKLLETAVTNLSKEELQEAGDKYKINIL